jgi:hypothetical protein
MDVRSSLFVNVPNRRLAARLLASAGACVMLTACVANPFTDAKVDPRSPIAAEVTKSVRHDAVYPTFASIPAAPKDVRPRKQYGEDASQIEKAQTDLDHATADNTWSLTGTEAFAANAQAAAGPDLPPVPPEETEAFANALRKRATPPPPTKR